MDKNNDYNYYQNYNMGYEPGPEDTYGNNAFNPLMQYEQAYMYYRYMTQNLEYKMKLREYEKLTKNDVRNDRRE